jgi:hypothetical protein
VRREKAKLVRRENYKERECQTFYIFALFKWRVESAPYWWGALFMLHNFFPKIWSPLGSKK